MVYFVIFFFFFKQKTAYEIYQCDWSSDVCSSDLGYISGITYKMKSGEVYPNAPLALVAAEIRYTPVAERSLGMPVQKLIRDLLGDDWVIRNDTSQTFQAGFGPGGPQASITHETLGRITSRQRTKVVTVRPDSMTLEVTDYKHFMDFRALLERACAATEQVVHPDGIVRAGLRYIDEISVPASPPDWSRWLDSALFPPASKTLVPSEWTGAVQYNVDVDQLLVFRYGPSAGPVVSPSGHLRRPRTPPGPIFMLDFDSSWQPSDIPAFTSDSIASVADRLRSPLRGLFDSLIKPDLLEIFRQEPDT